MLKVSRHHSMNIQQLKQKNDKKEDSQTYQKAFSSGIRSNSKPAKKFIACAHIKIKDNKSSQ